MLLNYCLFLFVFIITNIFINEIKHYVYFIKKVDNYRINHYYKTFQSIRI